MHLGDGRGRERRLVEDAEGLGQAHAELLGNDALDLGEGKRRHVVLQARERLGVGRRHDIGPHRQELAELDEGGSEGFDVGRKLFGFGGGLATASGVSGISPARPARFTRSPRPYLKSSQAKSL